jgi:hypothetical protein
VLPIDVANARGGSIRLARRGCPVRRRVALPSIECCARWTGWAQTTALQYCQLNPIVGARFGRGLFASRRALDHLWGRAG